MIETISMCERVTIFGDISGMNKEDISTFVAVTSLHKYGGSYPDRESTVSDEEIITNTRDVLTQAGILDPSPVIPCNSDQERAGIILDSCRQRSKRYGLEHYWIIDRHPDLLAAAMRPIFGSHVTDAYGIASMTIINLGSPRGADRTDQNTGIRICALPHPRTPFPMHPALTL